VALNFALNTLITLFGDISGIPSTVLCSYFAILKAMEIGAEKN